MRVRRGEHLGPAPPVLSEVLPRPVPDRMREGPGPGPFYSLPIWAFFFRSRPQARDGGRARGTGAPVRLRDRRPPLPRPGCSAGRVAVGSAGEPRRRSVR